MKTVTGIFAKIRKTLARSAVKNPIAYLPRTALSTWLHLSWRRKLNHQHPQHRALFQSTEELIAFCEVMVWAFVVCVVMLVFGGLVFTMLYSVTFVQQPLKTMAPIDMAYTKMLNDIVLLMTGSITTLIGMRVAKKASEMIANKVAPVLVPPMASAAAAVPGVVQATTTAAQQPAAGAQNINVNVMPDWNWMNWTNPMLDENWTPPPPPTTPADHREPEEDLHDLAHARAEQRGQ